VDAEARAAERRFHEQMRADLPRNFSVYVLHGLLGQTGFRLIQAPTFIPAYVMLLSGSELAVGIARALQSLGMLLSPILGATFIEHRRRVLGAGLWVGGLMRVQVLGLALAGFLFSDRITLYAVWLFLGLFGFFLGMQGVVFNMLVSKVVPVDLRGRLMGLRNALSGVVTMGVGVVGGWFVDANTLGNGYATTFLVAFGLTTTGLLFLTLVREPDSPQVRAQPRVLDRLRELPALLRSDREFTWYFTARALATMGRMSMPFYVLYAGTLIEVGGAELGWLTMAFAGSQSVGNLAWGYAADRTGFRAVFLVSLAVWMLSALGLMNIESFEGLVWVMIGLGAGLGGFMLSAQNMVLEFGSRQNLPMRIAVANTASEAVGAAGALAGGLLATLSYTAVFWTGIVFQLAAFALVIAKVDDPRHRT